MREPTQEDCDRLVRREVHYCVSSLIYTLAQGAQGPGDVGEMCEAAAELFSPLIDHEEAARDAIRNWSIGELQQYCEFNDITACSAGTVEEFAKAMREAIYEHLTVGYDDAWECFCNDEGVEPYESEIYEHWIVSNWLARELQSRGHRVNDDFWGLTIWGRPCTGQAIALDSVIVDITRQMLNA